MSSTMLGELMNKIWSLSVQFSEQAQYKIDLKWSGFLVICGIWIFVLWLSHNLSCVFTISRRNRKKQSWGFYWIINSLIWQGRFACLWMGWTFMTYTSQNSRTWWSAWHCVTEKLNGRWSQPKKICIKK